MDHFMVLTDSAGVEDKIREAHSCILALRPSAKVDCMVGIYQLGRWGADPNLAVTRVKIACDSIHDSGDHFMAYYTEALDRKVELKDYVSRHMDEAVEKGYIKAYYQPIVRTMSGALCGMEALARWEDPKRGFLQPADFISALEESRQIHKLDLEIIRQVCENFSRCMAEGRPVVPVSVNLSRLDFLQCDIFQEVENRVLEYNVPRDMIHIEITERLLNAMDARIRQGLHRFRKAGYEIWMDDFGSGYSSLNLLKGYFFDVLKIDMAFLGSSSERARKIISSIISMDKSIGTRSLAEGVETREQFEFLKNRGCEKVQDFFFGKPMPYEESLDHCMREGLKVETRAWKAYYDAIGMVNFQTDETLTLLEYDGHRIRYLFANSAYIDMIHHVGDQFLKAVGRSIARCNGRACIKIRVSNITGSMTHEEQRRVYQVLHNVYAVYDDIFLLDRDRDTLEPMAVSDGDWSEHEKIPHAGSCIRDYGLRSIYADDYERYMAFMDMDTLEKRIQKAGVGFLSGFFRTRVEDGRFIWMIHTLIPIPRTDYGQVLHCIHRLSGNRADFPEALALPAENREKDMFQPGELWNSLIHGTRRAYFWKDREGRYQGASRNFLLYTGLPSVSAMKGKTSSDMGWLMDDHGARNLEGRVLSGVVVVNRPMDIIVKGVAKSIVYGKVPVYRDGEIIGTLGWFEDAEQMEKETGRQPVMVTDRVTGVMNSRGVIESLIGCQEAYRNFGSDYAMLFLTIPQYRRIFHSYGEKTANGLLKAAAGKIRHIMGTRGTVGRLDGAGFVILFHSEDQTEVTFLHRKLRQAIADIHEVGGSSCTVTAEIIITYGSDGITTGRLLREAVGMMRSSDDGYRDKMDRWLDREALFDALPLPYALLDTPMGEDGGISQIICRYHNEAYAKALGLKENEELSRHLTSLLNQENYSWGQKAYEAAYEKHTLYGEKYIPPLAKTIRYMVAPGP
ncbi:EAL domain-containing protein [uncultured Dialister sp.]|uniref:bifunctional diguanylate cyclase/phosphodiesterase n=1 Tax=uncultured Dialister sp. TaxID=278064 RepID=UPI002597B139|nr:EAL domain-containing protein [uncultured Dialister sp.]